MKLLKAYSVGYALGRKVKAGLLPYILPDQVPLPSGISSGTPQARAFVEGYKRGLI